MLFSSRVSLYLPLFVIVFTSVCDYQDSVGLTPNFPSMCSLICFVLHRTPPPFSPFSPPLASSYDGHVLLVTVYHAEENIFHKCDRYDMAICNNYLLLFSRYTLLRSLPRVQLADEHTATAVVRLVVSG